MLLAFALALTLALTIDGAAPAARPAARPAVFGLELDVPDAAAAAEFYVRAFDCKREPALSSARATVLALGELRLALRPSTAPAAEPSAAGWILDLRVRGLEGARARAQAAGAVMLDDEPRRIPIGLALALRDPWGHAIHLIDVDDDAPERDFAVFALGATAERWDEAEQTFADLGFAAATRAYLPAALPLEPAGAAALVLHAGALAAAPAEARGARLLLATRALEPALAELAQKGLVAAGPAPASAGALGRAVAFRGASGLGFRLVERSDAQLAFERMRALAGEWEGASDKGWNSRICYQVIAGGSAVMETTAFEAHPGETMVTIAHMDGARLLLTHYCVAWNQPVLEARGFGDDGRTLVFEYAGGTNLASREQGHMDRAEFRFESPDAFSSTWSWYENGAPGWKEEIRYRRAAPAGAEASSPAGAACHPKR